MAQELYTQTNMAQQKLRAAGLILLSSLLFSTHVLAQESIDWKHIPQSQLPTRLADIVCELEPALSQKKSVLLPLPAGTTAAPLPSVSKQKRNVKRNPEQEGSKEIPPVAWNFEAYVSEVFTGLMAASGLTPVDAEPCLDLLVDKNGKRRNPTPKLIQQAAKKTDAAVVLAPRLLFRGPIATLQVTAYDGENGKVLQIASCTLKHTDFDYLANTPKTNRSTVQ